MPIKIEASIPPPPPSTTEIINPSEPDTLKTVEQIQTKTKTEEHPSPQPETPSNDNLIKISDSYHYKKFYKMIKFGVPPTAVKNKMRAEGLDGNLLDDPNKMIDKCPEDDEVDDE